MPLLNVRGVSHTYRDRYSGETITALADVSFDVATGEFVCLIGPSGSGKTTLLNILAGFIKPTKGHVLAAGAPVTGPGPDRGVVFQEYALFPWMTIVENVMFGLRNKGLSPAPARKRAMSVLKLVGLGDVADAYPHQLSGGMQQRVAIARVWALGSRILLMDEPFGALDVATRCRMQEHLLELWHGSGKTVIFVTHNVTEAVVLADRVIVFPSRPGRVVVDVPIIAARPRSQRDAAVKQYERRLTDALGGSIANGERAAKAGVQAVEKAGVQDVDEWAVTVDV